MSTNRCMPGAAAQRDRHGAVVRRHGLRPRLAGADPRRAAVQGFGGLSLKVFTEMTPPPGADGGLLNAIVGSLIHDGARRHLRHAVGMLAGTYMAEYGRHDKLTSVLRFINDILLSAPSIVIGLFIYEIVVAPMGHFSGWPGPSHSP